MNLYLRLAAVLACTLVTACGRGEPAAQAAMPQAGYVETGDLDALRRHGELRILVPVNLEGGGYLPRKGGPVYDQQEAARDFAQSLGLRARLVPVISFKDMIPMLLAGHGDLIAANLTVTPERKGRIAFSVPLTHVREQVVTRASDTRLRSPDDLTGRTIAVDPSTSFWKTIQTLKKEQLGLTVQALPANLRTDDIMDQVADGTLDLTVQDSNAMQMYLSYRDDLRVAFDISGDRPIAWGLRPDAVALKHALDRFLNLEKLTERTLEPYREDLPGIRRRKVLRVLLRNNAASYFLWRGELMGFEYELARHFAKSQGLRLEAVVPPSHDQLLPWLKEGRADVAAGFLVDTPARRAQGVRFSRPFHYDSEVLVSRAGVTGLATPRDLAGRTLTVRRSSSYWETLSRLRDGGIDLRLQAAPEDMETEEIIDKVAEGEYALTVADQHILDIALTTRDDIQAAFPVSERQAQHWAVREDSPELLAALNRYFKKAYRGLFYNIIYKKYFKSRRNIRSYARDRIDRKGGRLSPFDDIVRRYAEEYGFDWRLITAQMYQESRFDPKAKSWSGARGLMQVMPRTARQLGISELQEPEKGILAGVKYLARLRDRFDEELPVADRAWLALASYNAGMGHVLDARRLARRKAWHPDRWFGNVERAMLLLGKPKYARKAKHGFVRGSEPVRYVRAVRNRYQAYVDLTEQQAESPKPGTGVTLAESP